MVSQRIILVISTTDIQGLAVIDALLAPGTDGSASSYSIRALTRDPESARAQELQLKGVECVKGSVDDFDSVRAALQGAYGVWVDAASFMLDEQGEIHVCMSIFELARQTPSMRHYVWSNIDYSFKTGELDENYHCEHCEGKGRVSEWLRTQSSDASSTGFAWSQVTTGPYMEMISYIVFGPLDQRADGTYVFATPAGSGHLPVIALEDLGFFARYSFDNRESVSAQDLRTAGDIVDWYYLVQTFTKVTEKPAIVLHQTYDDWIGNFDDTELPIANALRGTTEGVTATTWRENFRRVWNAWRDDIVVRDMDWARSVHPGLLDLETWMRKSNFTGEITEDLSKNGEDKKNVSPRLDRASQL